MEINTNGITNFKGNSFRKIDYLNIFKEKKDLLRNDEDIEQIYNIQTEEIIANIKLIDWERLETLQEGLYLIIKGV